MIGNSILDLNISLCKFDVAEREEGKDSGQGAEKDGWMIG